MCWPSKEESEDWQIARFVEYYERLHRRTLVVESKGERPDRTVRDPETGDRFGVELTSVYLHDRSVPDEHIKHIEQEGQFFDVDDDKEKRIEYRKRIVEAIAEKVEKARNGYHTRHPLMLSVYLNDYIRWFFRRRDFQEVALLCERRIGSMAPFCEVVFWPISPDELSDAPAEAGDSRSTALSWRPKGQPDR